MLQYIHMIDQLLQKLGLADKEREVYLAIVAQGKTTPARVAKATNIHRSTVYAVAEKLLEKGLIEQDISSKVIFFSPASPERVEEMFRFEKMKLQEKKKIAEQLADEIRLAPQNKNYAVPKIRFVEEVEVEEFLYENMEKWSVNTKQLDDTCWGFQDHSFAQHYEKWIEWAWKKYKMQINLLSNDSVVEKKLAEVFDKKRDIAFWGKGLDFTSSIWVMGEYLVMIVSRQKPHYLVEIRDGVLAHNLREVFRRIWLENNK